MRFLKDFREFAVKGNVMDLAAAVIIGAAFGAIVSSLVDDIITPLLLTPALNAVGAKNIEQLHWGTVKYGAFLSAVIKFLIYSFVIFALISFIKRLQKKKEELPAAPPPPSSTDVLLMEIRDELRSQKNK